ncbi:mevalonate kinase-like [Physella acuta]|uniref:mevalonate kinase-like n=1 Tax=Physella acuta TaxID=109671 RepID=UPI0027DD9D60|nr:mevalonate kinase-like [Physella acuta]
MSSVEWPAKEIHISAPGKVILHGEHAVVYGKAAIAASLNVRCFLKLKVMSDSNISLCLPDVNINTQMSVLSIKEQLENFMDAGSIKDPSGATDDIVLKIKKFAGIDPENKETKNLAIVAFLYLYSNIFHEKGEYPAMSISMKSDLPVGAGLGSSAAFSVSLAAAFLELAGFIESQKLEDEGLSWKPEDKTVINKWAFIGEKIIHGRPSGIDNAISTYGGALKMQSGTITAFEKMPTLSVMLVNTQVPRSTMTLVAGVRQKHNLYQDIMDPILNAVEAISKRAEDIYKSSISPEHYKTLGELMELNHNLLNAMGVGHPTLDQIVAVTKKHGFHSKLTGAGGGGCAFVLVPPSSSDDSIESLKTELTDLGYQVWKKISVGGPGVLREL